MNALNKKMVKGQNNVVNTRFVFGSKQILTTNPRVDPDSDPISSGSRNTRAEDRASRGLEESAANVQDFKLHHTRGGCPCPKGYTVKHGNKNHGSNKFTFITNKIMREFLSQMTF